MQNPFDRPPFSASFVLRAKMAGQYIYWNGENWSHDSAKLLMTNDGAVAELEYAIQKNPRWMGNRSAEVCALTGAEDAST